MPLNPPRARGVSVRAPLSPQAPEIHVRPRRSEVSHRRAPRRAILAPLGRTPAKTVFLPATGLLRSGPSNARGEAPTSLLETSRTAIPGKCLHAAIPSSRGGSIARSFGRPGQVAPPWRPGLRLGGRLPRADRRIVTTGRAIVVARDLSKRDATPGQGEPRGERENWNESADSVVEVERGVRQFCRETTPSKQTRRTSFCVIVPRRWTVTDECSRSAREARQGRRGLRGARRPGGADNFVCFMFRPTTL